MEKKKENNKHRQYLIAGGALVLIVALLLVACGLGGTKDAAKFKSEYEKLNGEKTSSGREYQTLKINKKNKVKYASLEEAEKALTEGTHLIYFGMPNCPWCREIVPVLLEKTDCSCLKNILYVDMTDKRNTYEIQNDEPVETKKAESAYYNVLSLLDKYLDNYKVDDSDGVEHVLQEKRIYLPMVVAVKDGRVVDAHTGSVELTSSQTPYDELTDVQKSELGVIFTDMIEKLTEEEAVCNGKC